MKIWLAILGFSSLVHAGEVIDLGTLEVRGKARGPEIQLIESNRVSQEAMNRFSRKQLSEMETALLEHEAPIRDKGVKKP